MVLETWFQPLNRDDLAAERMQEYFYFQVAPRRQNKSKSNLDVASLDLS